MSKPLLTIVQDILSTLDSDTVNSITDTMEADQIARIVKNVYLDMAVEYGFKHNQKLSYLESVSDTARPTHLKIPSNVNEVLWWQYDCRLDIADPYVYNEVVYLDPKDFVEMCNKRDSSDTTNNQVVTLESNVHLVISKVQAPRYYTSFDNEYVVCDSYDIAVDTTLQQSKTQAFLEFGPTFTLENTFVPDLPENLEPLFYRTAENLAFALFKQTINPKLERKEHDLRIRAQHNKERLKVKQNNWSTSVNFGR